MGIKKQYKKAKKATSKAADSAVHAAGAAVDAAADAVGDGVDWAEGVGKAVANQAVNLSAEAERLGKDAAQELAKFGGDLSKALQSAIWIEMLKKLAKQVVKDNDGLLKEALRTAKSVEQKADELRNLALQSTKVFTRELQGDAVADVATDVAGDLNF